MSFSKDGINACISVDERSRFKFREKFHKKKKKEDPEMLHIEITAFHKQYATNSGENFQ